MALKELETTTSIAVRFSEVDSMGVVWHGNYVSFFEDGREDFGSRHGISYVDFSRSGVRIPVVRIEIDYKRPLLYGDRVRVKTRFVNSEAAKIRFEYTVYRNDTDEVVATGSTTQVFVNENNELLLEAPLFFTAWKKKHGLG